MTFNLDSYETVKERKKRFYNDHKEGSITVELLSEHYSGAALFRASVYIDYEKAEKNLPRGVGYAYEVRDHDKKVSSQGKEYESINYSSWVENCEESAIGRALDNAGYSSGKCSREEMKKVTGMQGGNKTPPPKKPALINANWVIPFGKFKGTPIKENKHHDLLNYANFLKTSAEKNNEPLKSPALEFCNYILGLPQEKPTRIDGAPNEVRNGKQ